MSVKSARKFLMISRFGLPLTMLYGTGFAIGDIAYWSTGHLGLFYGPLGDLRRAVLSGRRQYASAPGENWVTLISLAVLLIVLAVEYRHQLRRPRPRRRFLLIIGYCLGAMSIAAPVLGFRRSGLASGSEVFLGAFAASGLVLAVGAWQYWGTGTRIVAPLVCTAGVVMALWALRMEDRARLGVAWQNGSQREVAWVTPCSRTRS
jgi:hypothetical protein